MATLTSANRELYQRTDDETFGRLPDLRQHCEIRREAGEDLWRLPGEVRVEPGEERIALRLDGEAIGLNDWSFSQLCRLCGVNKQTVNRLTPETASRVLAETIPRGGPPIQLLREPGRLRSLHGAAYTRIWNAEVLDAVCDAAPDLVPPHRATTGGSGLYAGEQDMFAFLVDPAGWVEIGDEAFAPGLFVWNSEVGRRSLGVQTFWYQRICGNHIVWDAVEVAGFTRKHTANVHEGLDTVRRIVADLVARRDERRDGFARVLERAAAERLGDDAESVLTELRKHGLPKRLAEEAIARAAERGAFTILAVVDALTRLTQRVRHAGDRTDADRLAGRLLSLVA